MSWKEINETDIKNCKNVAMKHELSKAIYPILFLIIRDKRCPIKNISTIPVEVLDYPTFEIAFNDHIGRKTEKAMKKNKAKASNSSPSSWLNSPKGWSTSYKESWPYKKSYPSPQTQSKKEEDNIYDKFEYGLSDW